MSKALSMLHEEESKRFASTDDEGFGALTTDRGCLPLTDMDVQVRIDGLLSSLVVSQTFVNRHDEPLEATYIFPLPDRAAITAVRFQVGERVIECEIQERGAARREYEQALQAGHRAAIAEENRSGVFSVRVGNLLPGDKATVRLSLTGPLSYGDGQATFRFPLVVAPRYIPGEPLPGPSVGGGTEGDTDAVPDASCITPPVLLPGFPNPVRLSLGVEVRPSPLLGEVRSSLHAVEQDEAGQEEAGGGVRRIRLEAGERLDRDFILRFRVAESAVKTSLIVFPDTASSDNASSSKGPTKKDGAEGTFLLTIVPPAVQAGTAQAGSAQAGTARPRDVAIVLDRSGSMQGWKMVTARRAAARMVDTLSDHDRFLVLAFDNSVETPAGFSSTGLLPASDRNRYRAVEFLARLEARGGTELAQPLDLAAQSLSAGEANRERVLLLVTDGQVGNEDQILANLGTRAQDLRIFTLGIDQAVNEGFLRRLACLGGGACELVESEDRLDEVLDKVHRRIGRPVLTGLRLEPAGLRYDPDSLVPSRLPDVFADSPLVITGRYRGAAGGIHLHAQETHGLEWSQTLQAAETGNPAVTCGWARGRIRDLEDRYAIGSENRGQLEKQIVDASLRFNVLSRFTAFVAVDKSEVVNAGGKQHRVTQPVELPAGWGSAPEPTDSLMRCFASTAPSALAPQMAGGIMRQAKMRKSGGLIASLKSTLSNSAMDRVRSPEPPVPLDLTGYRRRVAAWLAEAGDFGNYDLPRLSGLLADWTARLAELVADLQSVGASANELHSLEKLLDDLRQLLVHRQVAEAECRKLAAIVAKALREFSIGAAAGRSASFWK